MLMKGLNQCCEGIQFPMLKSRVQGEFFVTQTHAQILLFEPTHKPNIGNNFLLNLDPKLEPWKHILEKTRAYFSDKEIYLF